MRTSRALVVILLVAVACTSDSARPETGADSSSAPLTGEAVPAHPSSGCGTPRPNVTDDVALTISSGGIDRSYFLHLPPSYDETKPLPLVLDFHGYAEGAALHKITSQLGPFGDKHDFVTVTPAATGVVPAWNTSPGGPDVQLVRDLLDSLEGELCVDERRVYAAGYSHGAMLSSAIACALSDRVAAIAPVAGVIEVDGCAPARPVPVIAFHGTADPIVAFEGGVAPGLKALPAPDGSGRTLGDLAGNFAGFAPIPEAIATFARLDGCRDGDPSATTVAADVTLLAFACPQPVEVQLYRVEGGGHSWPGSAFSAQIASFVGPTTMSIDANTLIWEFFQAHPLPA